MVISNSATEQNLQNRHCFCSFNSCWNYSSLSNAYCSSIRFLLKQYKHMSTFIRVGQTELAGNLEIKQNTPVCMYIVQ
jgi:hypothetical protein